MELGPKECEHFLFKGRCKFGSACRNSHLRTLVRVSSLHKHPLGPDTKASRKKFFCDDCGKKSRQRWSSLKQCCNWIVDSADFDATEFGVDASQAATLPDISVDPESNLLTVLNVAPNPRAFYVTIGHAAVNENGDFLEPGTWRDASGTMHPCITVVLMVPPVSVVDVCFILLDHLPTGEKLGKKMSLELHSDITELPITIPKQVMEEEKSSPFVAEVFPLGFCENNNLKCYQCSQGVCGMFTHFYPGTCHAVDIACPVGTPVVAIGAGVILEVRQKAKVGGIHVNNLFDYNSVMIQLDDEEKRIVEYVHIKTDSVLVTPGDRVVAGQKICESGDVGFCPEPHLHLQMHLSAEPKAPTIPFAVRCCKGNSPNEAFEDAGPEALARALSSKYKDDPTFTLVFGKFLRSDHTQLVSTLEADVEAHRLQMLEAVNAASRAIERLEKEREVVAQSREREREATAALQELRTSTNRDMLREKARYKEAERLTRSRIDALHLKRKEAATQHENAMEIELEAARKRHREEIRLVRRNERRAGFAAASEERRRCREEMCRSEEARKELQTALASARQKLSKRRSDASRRVVALSSQVEILEEQRDEWRDSFENVEIEMERLSKRRSDASRRVVALSSQVEILEEQRDEWRDSFENVEIEMERLCDIETEYRDMKMSLNDAELRAENMESSSHLAGLEAVQLIENAKHIASAKERDAEELRQELNNALERMEYAERSENLVAVEKKQILMRLQESVQEIQRVKKTAEQDCRNLQQQWEASLQMAKMEQKNALLNQQEESNKNMQHAIHAVSTELHEHYNKEYEVHHAEVLAVKKAENEIQKLFKNELNEMKCNISHSIKTNAAAMGSAAAKHAESLAIAKDDAKKAREELEKQEANFIEEKENLCTLHASKLEEASRLHNAALVKLSNKYKSELQNACEEASRREDCALLSATEKWKIEISMEQQKALSREESALLNIEKEAKRRTLQDRATLIREVAIAKEAERSAHKRIDNLVTRLSHAEASHLSALEKSKQSALHHTEECRELNVQKEVEAEGMLAVLREKYKDEITMIKKKHTTQEMKEFNELKNKFATRISRATSMAQSALEVQRADAEAKERLEKSLREMKEKLHLANKKNQENNRKKEQLLKERNGNDCGKEEARAKLILETKLYAFYARNDATKLSMVPDLASKYHAPEKENELWAALEKKYSPKIVN
eukprot:g2713.t1